MSRVITVADCLRCSEGQSLRIALQLQFILDNCREAKRVLDDALTLNSGPTAPVRVLAPVRNFLSDLGAPKYILGFVDGFLGGQVNVDFALRGALGPIDALIDAVGVPDPAEEREAVKTAKATQRCVDGRALRQTPDRRESILLANGQKIRRRIQ